jgi:hypothetical protein
MKPWLGADLALIAREIFFRHEDSFSYLQAGLETLKGCFFTSSRRSSVRMWQDAAPFGAVA